MFVSPWPDTDSWTGHCSPRRLPAGRVSENGRECAPSSMSWFQRQHHPQSHGDIVGDTVGAIDGESDGIDVGEMVVSMLGMSNMGGVVVGKSVVIMFISKE